MENGCNNTTMDNDIKCIQNTLWIIYKEFQEKHDIKRYTEQAAALCKLYEKNPFMLNFCRNLVVSWTPVINALAEKYRKDDTMC